METQFLRKSCLDLDSYLQQGDGDFLQRDIDGNELYNEILCFKAIVTSLEESKPYFILNYIITNDLTSCFPNLAVALRIFLTLPVTVASGERSFSKLKLIKNFLRSTMSQERLTNLATISIEHEICQNLDISNIIDDFASKKARRVLL